MTDADRLRLVEQLQRTSPEAAKSLVQPGLDQIKHDEDARHREGRRFMLFRDTVGKLTIGWGRNIQDRGISEDEADVMLGNDINTAEDDLRRTFPWFRDLDSVRQAALVNLCFNLGLTRLLTFQRALQAMARKDYAKAAAEFFDSKWRSDVGVNRAMELTEQIRTGWWKA